MWEIQFQHEFISCSSTSSTCFTHQISIRQTENKKELWKNYHSISLPFTMNIFHIIRYCHHCSSFVHYTYSNVHLSPDYRMQACKELQFHWCFVFIFMLSKAFFLHSVHFKSHKRVHVYTCFKLFWKASIKLAHCEHLTSTWMYCHAHVHFKRQIVIFLSLVYYWCIIKLVLIMIRFMVSNHIIPLYSPIPPIPIPIPLYFAFFHFLWLSCYCTWVPSTKAHYIHKRFYFEVKTKTGFIHCMCAQCA